MTDAPAPAAPKKGMNPILKWLLIGCGTIVLLCILAFASCAYLFKKKVYDPAKASLNQAKAEAAEKGVTIDTSHGMQGFAFSMATASLQGVKPAVLMSLPKEEQPTANKAFADLNAKGGLLQPQDMDDISKVLDTYNDSVRTYQEAHGNPRDPEAARQLVKDLQAIADRH